jgi:hypothetical protein
MRRQNRSKEDDTPENITGRREIEHGSRYGTPENPADRIENREEIGP